jgi:hypothetical protein
VLSVTGLREFCKWSEWCVKDVEGAVCLSGVYPTMSTQRPWADGMILAIQAGMYWISHYSDCTIRVVLQRRRPSNIANQQYSRG